MNPKNTERIKSRKEFVYESTRYLQGEFDYDSPASSGGRQITFKVKPSRLSAYPLAVALSFDHFLQGEARSVFEEELLCRLGGYLEKACEENNLDIDIFRTLFRNNLEGVIASTLKRKYNAKLGPSGLERSSYAMIPSEKVKTRSQRETNQSIFLARLVHTIYGIARRKSIPLVCSDYTLVKNVVNNPDQFFKLQDLCAVPLARFLSLERVSGLDLESQRQEGLLSIWAAAQNYEARNFARFSTLARKALHFKFTNLLAFHSAIKRRTNKHLMLMGGTTDSEDSWLIKELDQEVVHLWAQEQAILDVLDKDHNAHNNQLESAEISSSVLESAINGFPTRSFSPAEINSHVLNLPKGARRVYRKRKISLEDFEAKAVILSHSLRKNGRIVVEEDNFPHQNECELFLDVPRIQPQEKKRHLPNIDDYQAREYADFLERQENFYF